MLRMRSGVVRALGGVLRHWDISRACEPRTT